ncbi:MAG: hypothetical protein CM1200mP36_09770 [Gammaproteobacteria bacterium]|nr:MAG: hypothetical protein CM1200mP36_09770 [Gammaproteobacteria bacterium]
MSCVTASSTVNWERPLLSKRDRSLVTVAVNQALYATNELRFPHQSALDENGVTAQGISEVILHVTFYAGGRGG